MSADFKHRLNFDLAHGELRDGDTRYVIMRADGLMGLFKRLSAPARAEALEAFAASVTEHGARSAARYTADDGDARYLLATVAANAPQLGWGLWHFSLTEAKELQLEVKNSPFARGYGPSADTVCAPITGMFSAVASIVFDAPAQAEEHLCAASGGTVCRFSARLRQP